MADNASDRLARTHWLCFLASSNLEDNILVTNHAIDEAWLMLRLCPLNLSHVGKLAKQLHKLFLALKSSRDVR